jgi:thymidine kinase
MSLKLYIGPMFSGKTSKIMEIYYKYIKTDMKVMVINHSFDVRYSNTMLSNHNKEMIPCRWTDTLSNISCEEIAIVDVILINEGQFFNDLYKCVKQWVDTEGKKVYVCGLDGDSNRNKFGEILDIIPLADKVVKLNSLCSICKNGTKAVFTIRLTHETSQILIGSDCYKPVCRQCYNFYSKQSIDNNSFCDNV